MWLSKLIGVEKVCDIIVDLTNVDISKFPTRQIKESDRSTFPTRKRKQMSVYRLEYTVQVWFGSQDGVLDVKAVMGKETVGNVRILYSTEDPRTGSLSPPPVLYAIG